jgi:hypothetical protein
MARDYIIMGSGHRRISHSRILESAVPGSSHWEFPATTQHDPGPPTKIKACVVADSVRLVNRSSPKLHQVSHCGALILDMIVSGVICWDRRERHKAWTHFDSSIQPVYVR